VDLAVFGLFTGFPLKFEPHKSSVVRNSRVRATSAWGKIVPDPFRIADRSHRGAPLSLVASTGPGDARSPHGSLNWSLLMTRAQDGDRQAYRALLEDMTPYLRSVAGRCFKEASDVEDTVQDVLLTVHAIRHAYDPGRPFGPWLLAIANRRIIDRLRRQTRAKLREIALAAEHETFAGGRPSGCSSSRRCR